MDDTSTCVANARLGKSLRLDYNNETVVSGMTDVSCETPSVVSSEAYEERDISSSLPSSRFRGGTASRFGYGGFVSGRSVGGFSSGRSVGGGSVSSRMSRLDRSTRSGISQLHEIAEEEAESDMSMGDDNASVYVENTSDGVSIRSGSGFGGSSVGGGPPSGGGGGHSVGGYGSVSGSGSGSVRVSEGSYSQQHSQQEEYSNTGAGFNTEGMFSAGMFSIQETDDASVSSGLTTGMQSVAMSSSARHPTVDPEFEYERASSAATPSFSSRAGGGDESVVSSSQRSMGSTRDRPSAPYSAANSVSASGNSGGQQQGDEEFGITNEEQADILLNAFDNTRLPTHTPKLEATKEINVSYYQEVILDSDETSQLPEEYVLDEFGRRYHPKPVSEEDLISKDPSLMRPDYEHIPIHYSDSDEPYKGPFGMKRKWYSLITILAAITLAVAGLCISIQSLRSSSSNPETQYNAPYGRSLDNYDGGHLYLPGYQFGGGLGGLVGGQERERRIALAYGPYGANFGGQQAPPLPKSPDAYAPAMPENSGASYNGGRTPSSGMASYQTSGHFFAPANADPYGGQGPPQFNPQFGSNHLPSLTSTPLTSYAPPPSNHGTTVVFNPEFNGMYMDLMVLPYNPQLEIPVVWDVPLSGGSATKSVFGNCLRLVQCNERGKDILARERELLENGGDGSGRRLEGEGDAVQMTMDGSKISFQIMTSEATSDQETLFDPPLRTEVVYTSAYVNVDCTNPSGVNRGISHELATSNIADVIYSPDIHDVGRLFAPPIEMYGRMVVMMRDPMERSVAKYEWMKFIDDDVKRMSLEEFSGSDHLEDNLLTRSLTNKSNKDLILNNGDLIKAKEILSRKFVIGLFDHMEDSLERFETFFGWNTGDAARTCQHNEVGRTKAKYFNQVAVPMNDMAVMMALREKNGMDEQLYEYARFLYDYQGHALFGINSSV